MHHQDQPFFCSDKPLVSVVIPTYNRLPLLLEAIVSVAEQTYSNWELIIVDDGSTDGTTDIIDRIGDQRICIISLPHTGHIGNLLNTGVKNSHGEWLAFLDSDDLWTVQKLETQLEVVKREQKRWVYGGFELMDENKKTIPNKAGAFIPLSGWITKEIITTNVGVNPGALLMQRTLFDEVGGFCSDPRLIYRSIYEFILRVSLKAEAGVTPHLVVKVREHSGRVTKTIVDPFEKTALAYDFFIDQKPGKEFEKLARKKRAFHLSEASVGRFQQGDHKIALQQLSQALWDGDNKKHWLRALLRGFYCILRSSYKIV